MACNMRFDNRKNFVLRFGPGLPFCTRNSTPAGPIHPRGLLMLIKY